MQTNLNDVRLFVTAARAGTFSTAAKELRLPTSTLSRAVTRLEQGLGTILLERGPKGLSLTDAGREYLSTCKRALRSLKEGRDKLEMHRTNPGGLLRIASPITLARDFLAPTLVHFIEAYPQLRIAVESYSSNFNQEPKEDIDIFFKVQAPKDSTRLVRSYPGTVRGLFASKGYVRTHGKPAVPADLTNHRCIGSGPWRLTNGNKYETPPIEFHVNASDPGIQIRLVCADVGIAVLPLWMVGQLRKKDALVRVLPRWRPEAITFCALYYGSTKVTPKIRAFLEVLDKYFGTAEDPRLRGHDPRQCFTKPGELL